MSTREDLQEALDKLGWSYKVPAQREGLTPREGLTEYKKGYEQAELDLKREPLSEEDIRTHTPFHYHDAEQKAFKAGVKYAERQHNITRCGK